MANRNPGRNSSMRLFYELMAEGLPISSHPCKSLAYLFQEGLKKAFSEEDGCFEFTNLRFAFFVMYIRGIITKDTYEMLLPLVKHCRRDVWECYCDGRIKFALCDDYRTTMDNDRSDGTYSEIYDPLEALKWVFEVLAEDDSIRNYLCMDSFEDMLLSAENVAMDEITARACLKMDDIRGDASLQEGFFFYFEEEEGRLDLYLNGEMMKAGMTGNIERSGSDYYFKIDKASAYLHINTESGKQELCQNINIIGFRPDGCLVYIDLSANKVCYENASGEECEICEYEDDMSYRAGDYLLAKSTLSSLEKPFRVSYDGIMQEASPEECAVEFWNYFKHNYSRILSTPWIVEEGILAQRFRRLTMGKRLFLGSVLETLQFVRSNKCWSFGPAFPLINSVKLLQKKGVDIDEDITKELFAIVRYNGLVNIKETSKVTPIFYFNLYRLSKQNDFLYLIRNDPQKLFVNDIVSEEKRKNYYDRWFETHKWNLDSEEEGNEPDYDYIFHGGNAIGVFSVKGHTVHAVTVPVNRGIVRENEIIIDAGDELLESHPGSVSYNLLSGKYIIRSPERNDELDKVIRWVFRHSVQEVEYRYVHDFLKAPRINVPVSDKN